MNNGGFSGARLGRMRDVMVGHGHTLAENRSTAATNGSGHSMWGKWPKSGMSSKDPSWMRASASLAWDFGNTLSRAPHTMSVGIFRRGRRSTNTSR
jgi:hypothetical protein